MLAAQGKGGADRVRRPRLSRRFGMEGIPEIANRLRHSIARRLKTVQQAPAPNLHSLDQRRIRPRHQYLANGNGAARRQRTRGRTGKAHAFALHPGRRLRCPAGIIIADTKFEFGIIEGGEIILIDEVLTPDSSRFWPADEYAAGRIRPRSTNNFCEIGSKNRLGNKTPPAPRLSTDIVQGTKQQSCRGVRKADR